MAVIKKDKFEERILDMEIQDPSIKSIDDILELQYNNKVLYMLGLSNYTDMTIKNEDTFQYIFCDIRGEFYEVLLKTKDEKMIFYSIRTRAKT